MITQIFRKIIRIPLTIACTTLHERQVLILEWIDQVPPTRDFWTIFGERLARLHRITRPQLRKAYDGGLRSNTVQEHFQRLYRHLPDFFPSEPPALLHGDCV